MTISPEDALAAWVADLERADIPATVADRVRLLLLDAIASAIAGRTTADMAAMEAAARSFAGDGDASVIGGGRLSAAGAALLNGYAITAATVCDVHRPTLCHVTPVVVPAALAMAERLDRPGAALLTALAAGMEVTVRLGLAMDYPRFRARGWHSPGVVGPFGGAAAAAHLLGLDARSTRDALAFAGSQAAGTFAGLGSSQVKLHQARGAMSGLLAAILAAEGLDGGVRILTDPDGGLFATYAGGGTPERLLDGLGERWELLDISLRRWPAASALQAVVQGCLELGSKGAGHESSMTDSTDVEIALPTDAYRMHGERDWRDQLSAFQSARYVAAVVLRDRRCWLDQFSQARLADPELSRFATDRVRVSEDASLPSGGAIVRVTGQGADERVARIEIPVGDPRAPLSAEAVSSKLREAAAATPLARGLDGLAQLLLELDSLPSVRALMSALAG